MLNYDDISVALDTGHLAGLGIDVFHTEPFPTEDPLLSHPKVIATPHIAGVTEISYRAMANFVVDNVELLLEEKDPKWTVNEV